MTKVRIAIVGLGGVGGFYGGLLAHKYENNPEVEICFVARGKHLSEIKAKGLKIVSGERIIIGNPFEAVEDISLLAPLDYIILCTKEYDLETILKGLKDSIHQNTVILPLLNGVSTYEKLQSELIENEVWQGCTYMVSRLKEPGIIENLSGRQKIVFGSDLIVSFRMKHLENVLKEAGINAHCTNNISGEVWEKYVLVSSSATATAFYNCSIGQVMQNYSDSIRNLISEATAIALKKEVKLPKNIIDIVISRLKAIPGESTTSMHSDFLSNREQTELNVMTGYMVEQGKLLSVPVPYYKLMYNALVVKQGEYL